MLTVSTGDGEKVAPDQPVLGTFPGTFPQWLSWVMEDINTPPRDFANVTRLEVQKT